MPISRREAIKQVRELAARAEISLKVAARFDAAGSGARARVARHAAAGYSSRAFALAQGV